MEIPIENDRFCFCCGPDNPHGLHLAIAYPAKGMAEASLVVDPRYAGWKGITHGGLLSTVLDELMAHACISYGVKTVTAEMTIRFLKAVLVGTPVRITGAVTAERGRVVNTEGKLYDAEGALAAEATARFVKV
ncbi:MAG: hypothetical protein A2177_11270 [Spirochaetes bacterium RBG_13_68_11]|nr:MAG: hypothetical protein A2177_11270 [Spirochaetes bacterium RBG_13_68_11]